MVDVKKKVARPAPEPLLMGGFDAVAEIAKKIVPKYHPHLASAVFEFVSRNKATKQGGKPVPGSVKKASPLERHLASKAGGDEPDFIMIVALDVWNPMQPSQRVALVDHLLTRCVGEEDEESGAMKYGVRPPEVQEFSEVVGRHGRWNDGLVAMAQELSSK